MAAYSHNDLLDLFKTIKEEPVDSYEEEPQVSSEVLEDNGSIGYVKLDRQSIESNVTDDGNNNKASSSRDPRIRSSQNSSNSKRSSFLSGTVSAAELIQTSQNRDREFLPKQIKNIRNHTENVQKVINSPSTSFYSKLPTVPVAGTKANRSPVISNNHNAQFVSQASSDNIREALEAQRYRNVPRGVQAQAVRVGADLDRISQKIRPPAQDVLTFYSLNSRTTFTQTNDVPQVPATQSNTNAAVQTTKNMGYFTITIDNLSDLTREQRKALEEFKKVMGIKDETSTSGILERITHRKANNHYNEPRENYRNGHAGTSRESRIEEFSNPPAPRSHSSAAKKSKYGNLGPG